MHKYGNIRSSSDEGRQKKIRNFFFYLLYIVHEQEFISIQSL